MTKFTYPDFRDAMRKHGEYANAMLMGLYTRYLNGDIAPCVAAVITPKNASTEPMPVACDSPTDVYAERPEVKNLADRMTQITQILEKHGQPMSLDQIATAMDFTVEHTRKIMLKMGAQNLVLVTQARVGRASQNRYSLAHDAGWRD